MTQHAENERVGVRPRLLLTPEVAEEHRPSIDLATFREIASAYEIPEEHIAKTAIVVTHEEHITRRPGSMYREGRFGSFCVVENVYSDGHREEVWEVKLHLRTLMAASASGYVPALSKIEFGEDVLDLNCSATLLHELGHVAMHSERLRTPRPLRGRLSLVDRLAGAGDTTRILAEEQEVVELTKRAMEANPGFGKVVRIKQN